MFMHSFIPTMLCVTKAEQDFINAVTMGGNATNTGSRDLDAIKKAVAATDVPGNTPKPCRCF